MGILDRVKDSFTTAGAEVGQKVSLTADTLKLNNQIRNNDNKIEKLIYDIGAKCVELHLMDEGSEYEEFFAQIRAYKTENEQCKEEIDRLNAACEEQTQQRQKEMKERQEQREIERREKELLKQSAETESQAMPVMQDNTGMQEPDGGTKLCLKCNNINDNDAKFCIFCGEVFQ